MSRRPMQHAVFALFLLPRALALLEIQIEGSHGWAQNLPPAASTTAGPASVGEPADLLSPIAQAFLFVCVHAPFGLGHRHGDPPPSFGCWASWCSSGSWRACCGSSATRLTACAGSTRNPSTGAVTPVGDSFPAVTDRLVHGRQDAQTQQVLS